MPQRVICGKCGTTLYDGVDLRYPGDIVVEYDGRCPKCRKKLSPTPKNIEIRLVERPRLPGA